LILMLKKQVELPSIFKEKSHFNVKCLLSLLQYVVHGYLWPGRKLTP